MSRSFGAFTDEPKFSDILNEQMPTEAVTRKRKLPQELTHVHPGPSTSSDPKKKQKTTCKSDLSAAKQNKCERLRMLHAENKQCYGSCCVDVGMTEYQCKLCKKATMVPQRKLTTHAIYHLGRNDIYRYSCPVSNCNFGNVSKTAVTHHIFRFHREIKHYSVVDNFSENMRAQLAEMMSECFGNLSSPRHDLEFRPESPSNCIKNNRIDPFNKITCDNVKHNPFTERPTVQKFLAGNVSCHICVGSFTSPINAEMILEHAFIHASHLLTLHRYRCLWCDQFTAPYEAALIVHIERMHAKAPCYIDEAKNLLDSSTLTKISTMCFGDPLLMLNLLGREADAKQIKQEDEVVKNETQFETSMAITDNLKLKNVGLMSSDIDASSGYTLSSEMEFYCGICNKCLRKLSSASIYEHVTFHLKNDFGLTNYKCHYCKFKNASKENLYKHIKFVHNKRFYVTDEYLEGWTVAKTREISVRIFGFKNLALKLMPGLTSMKFAQSETDEDDILVANITRHMPVTFHPVNQIDQAKMKEEPPELLEELDALQQLRTSYNGDNNDDLFLPRHDEGLVKDEFRHEHIKFT